MIRLCSVLLIIFISMTIAAGCVKVTNPAEKQGTATLSEITTATAVSPEGQPLAVASTFLASTPTVYVTAKISNAPENTSITAKWFYAQNEAGQNISQPLAEETKPARGTQYVAFSRQAVTGTWGSGQYSVSLWLNGKETATAEFTVRPLQQANVPAPTISYFRAIPESIMAGQAVTLSWSVSDATQVSVSPIGTVSPAGSYIVTPANSAEYSLTASNSAGSTSMKASVRVTSYISDKPDLVITDFKVEGARASFKVKNIGGVNTVKPAVTYLYIDGNYKASSLTDILTAGQERWQEFPNYNWSYGEQRGFRIPVRICADAQDVVGEYDELNNCLNLDW